MGFFTDTTVCIGCKACEVACKQWNDLPADGSQFAQGRLLRPHRRAVGLDVAPRAVRRAARALGGAPGGGRRGARRDAPADGSRPSWRGGAPTCDTLDLHVRRLQALHERRLPRRLPDRRADPHRVPDRRAAARRLQRLRLLHPGVPVRRRRPRPHRRAGRASARSATTGCEDGLEPACAKACPTDSIQFGPYDELVERRRAARGDAARARRSRARTSTAPATSPSTTSPAASARSSC